MSHCFTYKAIDRSGALICGNRFAVDRSEVEQWLMQQQALLLTLSIDLPDSGLRGFLNRANTNANSVTLEAFASSLSALLGARLLLPDALEHLKLSGEPAVKRLAVRLNGHLESGLNLSMACKAEQKIFGTVYPSLLVVGEATGDMGTAFLEVSRSVRWNRTLKQRIRQVLIYPLFMLTLATGVLGFLLINVVPQLRQFVMSMQQEFPWHTKVLFNTSNLLMANEHIVLMGLSLILLLAVTLWISKTGRTVLEQTLEKTWPIGVLLRNIRMARYFHTLTVLTRAGVDYPEAISQTAESIVNKRMASAAEIVPALICQGKSLSDAFRLSGLCPQRVCSLVAVGERTGDLIPVFQCIADRYDEDVARDIDRIQRILPHTLMLVVAALLMWIIVSVLGPLYDAVISSGAAVI